MRTFLLIVAILLLLTALTFVPARLRPPQPAAQPVVTALPPSVAREVPLVSVPATDPPPPEPDPTMPATDRIGSAVQGRKGTATWCAPTPSHCQSWGGNAHLGAMRSFRWGDRPYLVRVSHGGNATTVRVVSYCACPNTLIDLSPAAFTDLAPLSRGRIGVVVSGAVRVPRPPATDTIR